MRFPPVELRLPGWVGETLAGEDIVYPTARDRMLLAIELSRLNVRYGTGGPFGAAIFERETGRLLAPGVNVVLASGCSVAHAEMMAIMVAQKAARSFDLGAKELPDYELVASTEPCAMCFGGTTWSGVRGLVCGARDEDARSIGFDEGAKRPDWVESLKRRGMTVTRDVLRREAAAVLREYAEKGGTIYNSCRGETRA